MKDHDWDEYELSLDCCQPSQYRGCCASPCTEENSSMFDFWVKGEIWKGYSFCVKHAELLKDAQWRYRNQMGGNSVLPE